jgi:hypothetical protein
MAERRVLPYLDIPFQHGSPAVLKRMRRPAGSQDTLARIAARRAACPDLAIRSTMVPCGSRAQALASCVQVTWLMSRSQPGKRMTSTAGWSLPPPFPPKISSFQKPADG